MSDIVERPAREGGTVNDVEANDVEANDVEANDVEANDVEANDGEASAWRLRRRLERLIGIAASEGSARAPLRNGDEIFPAMLGSIAAAEHTIDLMTFVYWQGEIARQFAFA